MLAHSFLVGLDRSDDTLVYSMVKVMRQCLEQYKNNAPGANGYVVRWATVLRGLKNNL